MNQSIALIVFVLVITYFSDLSSLYAEPERADINFEKIYYVPPPSEAKTYSLNPGTYRGSFLEYPRNEKPFLLKNIKFKLQDTIPQNLRELSTLESVAINSEFALLENLKFTTDLTVALPPIADLGIDHFLERDVFNENYETQQDHRSFVPRSFTDDSRPSLLFNINYRPFKWAHLDLRLDSNWEDRLVRSNLLHKNRGFFRMSLKPFVSTSWNTGLDVVDTSHIKNNNLHKTNCIYFTELTNDWGTYRTFVRYQNENFGDHANNNGDYQADTFIVGVKKNWTKIDDAWIRVGVSHKEAINDENKQFAVLGFKYSPVKSVNFNMQNSYEVIKFEENERENINFTGGIEIKLPFNLIFRNFATVNKSIDGEASYQFLGIIFRRFKS